MDFSWDFLDLVDLLEFLGFLGFSGFSNDFEWNLRIFPKSVRDFSSDFPLRQFNPDWNHYGSIRLFGKG